LLTLKSQLFDTGIVYIVAKTHHKYHVHVVVLLEEIPYLSNGNPGSLLQWVSVDTTADRRKSDASNAMFDRKLKTASVTGRQQIGLSVVAT
jgi:hypothetical protein